MSILQGHHLGAMEASGSDCLPDPEKQIERINSQKSKVKEAIILMDALDELNIHIPGGDMWLTVYGHLHAEIRRLDQSIQHWMDQIDEKPAA